MFILGTVTRRAANPLLALALAASFLPGVTWQNGQFVQRNDGGFTYQDFPGSPLDQRRVPNEAINQIQCPPPARPRCGD